MAMPMLVASNKGNGLNSLEISDAHGFSFSEAHPVAVIGLATIFVLDSSACRIGVLRLCEQSDYAPALGANHS